MSKKSIILLIVSIVFIVPIIPISIIYSKTYRDIIISEEFTITGENSYTIKGELQNSSDKPIKIDELILSVNGRSSKPNNAYKTQYSLRNITINDKYTVFVDDLQVLDVVEDYVVIEDGTSVSVECIIDGKKYFLSNYPNGEMYGIIAFLIGAIIIFIFFLISLKKDKREVTRETKREITLAEKYYNSFMAELAVLRFNQNINENDFNKYFQLISKLESDRKGGCITDEEFIECIELIKLSIDR